MKKISLVGIVLGLTIALATFGMMNLYGNTGPLAHITVYGAGIPDAYGNQIGGIYIYQNTTGTWTEVTSVTSATFTNGSTLSIPANQPTIIEVVVLLNLTLAPDLTTAKTRTRVYITISGVVTSSSMVQYGGNTLSSYYVFFWYPYYTPTPTSYWTPATDTTYTCSLQYQAYY